MLTNSFLKNNLIAYIGNKRRLIPFLYENIYSLISSDKNIKTAVDLFAGSGCVGRILKSLDLKVYANDWEYYSYILNYAHLSINSNDTDKMFAHTGGLKNTINMLNDRTTIDDNDLYISKFYAPSDDNNPDIVNERMFYTNYNARRIDIIRHNIEELYKNKAINKKEYYYLIASLLYESATRSNTSGVFKAFHAGFGGRKGDALGRILKPIIIGELPLHNASRGSVTQLDAFKFAKKYKDKEFDLVYLDPPYNQHQYGSNYHLLNTIALWDKPTVNKEIFIDGKKTDKGAIRKDWIKTKSDYCYKHKATDALENLLKNINARHILLSYSTDGIINYDNLLDILNSHGSLSIKSSLYTRYRGARRSIVNTKKNVEYLFMLDTQKRKKSIKTEINIKKIEIEKIRLLLNSPFNSQKDTLNFVKNSSSVLIELKYNTHVININAICDFLENKDFDYIKEFENFVILSSAKNNVETLELYINNFENAVRKNNDKEIKYFATHLLSSYNGLSNKKASKYTGVITQKLSKIIKNYTENNDKKLSVIEKIKTRIDYNKSYSYIK